MEWHMIELGPPRWEGGNLALQPWHEAIFIHHYYEENVSMIVRIYFDKQVSTKLAIVFLQGDGPRFSSAEAWVLSRRGLCGICYESKWYWDTLFSEYFGFTFLLLSSSSSSPPLSSQFNVRSLFIRSLYWGRTWAHYRQQFQLM